jgi:hypothetical protein
MSDELKDFRYYADRAETYIDMADDIPTIKGQQVVVAVAAIYAELAKAAPKAEPKPDPVVPCNVSLHEYLDGRYTGNGRECVYAKGHVGDHRTSDGVFFTGLDNADFPGPGDK